MEFGEVMGSTPVTQGVRNTPLNPVTQGVRNTPYDRNIPYESSYLRGGLHLKPPKFEHTFVARHNFFPLSSVQIRLIPACCLLCVL